MSVDREATAELKSRILRKQSTSSPPPSKIDHFLLLSAKRQVVRDIAEFVAHDSRLRFRSLNYAHGRIINPGTALSGAAK